MARIDALPSIDIIHGLRGILDFYLWKGLPCVRSWPRTPRSHLSTRTLAAAALFGQIIKGYALLGALAKAAFDADAADQPRTGRDIFVSAVLGHLHEASMSDFLTLLQESRDFLESLTDLLHSLESVQTDRLQVRGQDQLPSFLDMLEGSNYKAVHGGGYQSLYGASPPEGQIWHITHATAFNNSNVCTLIVLVADPVAGAIELSRVDNPAALVRCYWSGNIWIQHDDRIGALFYGTTANDQLGVRWIGHKFTLET